LGAREAGRLGGVCCRLSPDATLHPAARPAKRQTVEAFVERMKGLAAIMLHSFKETVLGTDVHVFSNVAVALAACPGRRPITNPAIAATTTTSSRIQ
jgi:hypothetical protein